jgi:hypothetical protein
LGFILAPVLRFYDPKTDKNITACPVVYKKY